MKTFIKIIDNKKVALTNDEWQMYQKICHSYDRPNFKGEELFKGLFETDHDGIILYLIPPSSKYTSLEVFLFLVSIFQHQHARITYDQLSGLMQEVRSELNAVRELKKELSAKVKKKE